MEYKHINTKDGEFIELRKSDYLEAIPVMLAECHDVQLLDFIYTLLSRTMKG